MGEHDPDGVERDGEEMVGKKNARGYYTAGKWINFTGSKQEWQQRNEPGEQRYGSINTFSATFKVFKTPSS